MWFVALVITALALPAMALATKRAYHGPAGPGGASTVGLGVQFEKGKPTAMTAFEWHNIPAQCSGYAPTATSDKVKKALPIGRKRKFHGSAKFSGGQATAVLSGKVSRNGKRVTGTLRIRGSLSGCTSADTGVVDWTARP